MMTIIFKRISGTVWLGRGVLALLGVDALSSVGSGMTMPFLMMYLNVIKGIPLGTAGLAAAVYAVAGFAGNPIAGACSDRFGSRIVLTSGLLMAGTGTLCISVSQSSMGALLSVFMAGFGVSLVFPSQDSLLANLVSPGMRSRAFSVRHAVHNAGVAVGSFSAALLVSLKGNDAFPLIYAVDASTFLLAAILALSIKSRDAGVEKSSARGQRSGGYRAVLRDRPFLILWIAIAMLVSSGFAQFNSSFAIYVTTILKISPGVVSVSFLVNAVTVVISQVLMARIVAKWRRTSGIKVLCALWIAAWVLLLLAGQLPAAGVGFCVAYAAVFGLGETLLAPCIPPLVNGMAPDELRGRYNGASALAFTAGFASGPALAGAGLSMGLGGAVFVFCIGALAGCLLISSILERKVPASVNEP
ncbi:MFS transporter [Streptomyces sp. NPDC004787]|uniref:MFS transporter n=1 Tax=Streptomyces sp. NPDC004787 TaxID=3154291 RepID=UPI0033BBBA11